VIDCFLSINYRNFQLQILPMPKSTSSKKLSAAEKDKLFTTLKSRFEKNKDRHKGIDWAKVQARLDSSPSKCWSLWQMEESGGEPDVLGMDKKTGELTFYDCSPESPAGRRSVCYDPEALASRKEHKPKDSALGMAEEMGVEILSEEEYRALQQLGKFDTKTSSWVQTPAPIRKLGGALFGDRRYDTVWFYHNGAESYYAARGFRASLKV